MADNVVVTAGSGTTVAADEVADGTLGTVKVQYVKIMDGTIDGTAKALVDASGLAVKATQTGTWNVTVNAAIAAGTNIIGKFTTDQTTHGTTDLVAADITKVAGSAISQGHGTAAAAIRVELPTDGTGLVLANLQLAGTAVTGGAGATAAGTPRITLASDSPGIIATGTQAAPSASYLSTVTAGDIAAAATDSGNPVKIGGVGKTANPTAVTDGQRVNGLFDKLGKMITVGAIRDLKGVQQTSVSNTTSETTIVTAVASTFLDLYGLILANTGASTTKVTIKDATGGTTRAIIEVPTLETRGFMVPVDSAVPQATVNNNWTVTCGTATTALEVTAFYVKNI